MRKNLRAFRLRVALHLMQSCLELTAEYEREVERRERRLSNGRGGSEPQPIAPSLENFSFVWDEIQNLQRVDFGEHYSIVDGERIFIIEVIPGDYILYGLDYGSYSRLGVCFCLGSVGFPLPSGVITDLGYIIGDSAKTRSRFPEIAEETGFGPSSDPFFVLLAGTVRVADLESAFPPNLEHSRV